MKRKKTQEEFGTSVVGMTDYNKPRDPVFRCDQCEALMINGVFCHEIGCPNSNKTWMPDREQWVLFLECRICGCDVEAGECCDCQDVVEDDEDEEDEALTIEGLGFDDPDDVGASEYRAIYECVADGILSAPGEDAKDVAIGMLQEFESYAKSMRESLEKVFSLVVTNADGSNPEPTQTFTLDQLIEENSDEIALTNELCDCEVGATVVSGGGAAPLYTFTRIQ